MNKKYTWTDSIDDDIWRGATFDSIDECVKDAISARDLKDGDSIAVGELERHVASTSLGDRVIEQLRDEAFDEVGEVVDDWLCDTTAEEEEDLDNMLLDVVKNWMRKYNKEPGFYKVIPLYTITIGEGKKNG